MTPFSLLTGASLVVGYALLGAGWLVWKTTGQLQADARRFARHLTPALLAAIGAVSLYTSVLLPQYTERWFDHPGLLVTVPMPLLVLVVAFALWRSLDRGRGRDWLPFLLTLILFLLSMIGLAISIWPDVIPGRVTIWEAASPHSSQMFMLVGAGVLVPVIIGYTAWAYWVFRGKVGEEGYH
jgi:cytochrome d ubiquinol oxidase subunit II